MTLRKYKLVYDVVDEKGLVHVKGVPCKVCTKQLVDAIADRDSMKVVMRRVYV